MSQGGGHTPKAWRLGTHRAFTPEETVARVRPMLERFGITRVANLTGLDRTGVPVVMVCRPNARSSAVFHGKGLDLAAARASGIMEAIETWHAEHMQLPLRLASAAELGRGTRLCDVAGLPRVPGSRYTPDLPLLWVEGEDLIGGGRLWVPFEMVHADFTLRDAAGSGCFASDTNGLASGNQPLEAVSHALCEVIERDATSLWHRSGAAAQDRTRLDLASVSDPACRAVLERVIAAGLDIGVWDITTDVGVPAFQCFALDRTGEVSHPGQGAGCHPMREIAFMRAVTEAVQVRTTYIVGSREDIAHDDYRAATLESRNRAVHGLMRRARPARSFATAGRFAFDDFEGEVAWLVERLRAAGIRQAVAVDLAQAEHGVPVVRVVVPGLEGSDHHAGYVPGTRAQAAARHHAMSVCVFIGPTLRAREVADVVDAECLPPAAQGDVYRAVQRRPRAIGIVDGFFSGAPSVWHKEILWALSQGIHVFGSASMGALRAAELHSFGMRGVGRIFEAFRDGVLEDDDEVAVVHGPAETGFLAASEPMVNIRATLARAEAGRVILAATRATLEAFAKSLFFPQRTWPAVLACAQLSAEQHEALRQWLPGGRVDQKREDALEMLAAIRETLASSDPPQVGFSFEWTHHWDGLVARAAPEAVGAAAAMDRAVIEELRLEGEEAYGRARTRALLRRLAGAEARRQQFDAPMDARRATLTTLRAALGLFTRAALGEWMVRSGLDEAALERLIADETRLQRVIEASGAALDRELLDELRLNGAYARLAERAQLKGEALAGAAPSTTRPRDVTEARLWFFERRLGRSLPEDVAQFARELGFAHLADFDSAVLRERIYFMVNKTDRGG